MATQDSVRCLRHVGGRTFWIARRHWLKRYGPPPALRSTQLKDFRATFHVVGGADEL